MTQLTLALKQQFGLLSAAAFPPHATLVGNLKTEASPEELIKRLTAVFDDVPAVLVYNKGLERSGNCYLFNLDEDRDGGTNREMLSIATAVRNAVLPVYVPTNDYLVPPVNEASYWGHLSVASHDLIVNPELADEVGEFLQGLDIALPPATFQAEVYSLFEFTSDWDERWWETLTWKHLKSWTPSRR